MENTPPPTPVPEPQPKPPSVLKNPWLIGGLILLVVAIVSGAAAAAYQLGRTSTMRQTKPIPSRQPASPSSATTTGSAPAGGTSPARLVDTGQTGCYDNTQSITCPASGQTYFGQDAQYQSLPPSYTDNGDGTITDNVTGLMWIQDAGDKVEYYDATNAAKSFAFAGYSDWRVPTIKELYSLVDFSGEDVPNINATSSAGLIPFIDTNYFAFEYGDTSAGYRIIDSQWITSNIYTAAVGGRQECFFGFNFADGRIKCYPTTNNRSGGYFIRYVRGNSYGINDFTNNSDGTVTDASSGLTWQQADSGRGLDWENALAYCEDLSVAGHSDWRLPNAKELQYIVDYTRSPDATNSPAIDPIFDTTSITNEDGAKDYPYFWTGTTHKSETRSGQAVYIAFGECLGSFDGTNIQDVHGAGCQRSGPKSEQSEGAGVSAGGGSAPQGDINRVSNYVRCVRDGTATPSSGSAPSTQQSPSSGPPTSQPNTPPSSGQSSGGPGSPGGAPPTEALTACTGKTSGTTCSFSTPQGTITGTCRLTPDNQTACVPS